MFKVMKIHFFHHSQHRTAFREEQCMYVCVCVCVCYICSIFISLFFQNRLRDLVSAVCVTGSYRFNLQLVTNPLKQRNSWEFVSQLVKKFPAITATEPYPELRVISGVDDSLFYQKIDEEVVLRVPKTAFHIFSYGRRSLRMFSTSVRPSLNDLLQSYIWVLENVSSPNCALNLFRMSAGFTFSLVINWIVMRCATAKGTTCSFIVISANKKQVDSQ